MNIKDPTTATLTRDQRVSGPAIIAMAMTSAQFSTVNNNPIAPSRLSKASIMDRYICVWA
jgi:hypothetical protein